MVGRIGVVPSDFNPVERDIYADPPKQNATSSNIQLYPLPLPIFFLNKFTVDIL